MTVFGAALIAALTTFLSVSTIVNADACENAAFRQGPAADLPGCRAYEQVSPVDKNGGDIIWDVAGTSGAMSVAETGDSAFFSALTEFADPSQGGHQGPSMYLGRRAADGWETASVYPRPEPVAAGADLLLSSSDLGLSLLSSTGLLESAPPDTNDQEANLYVRDNDTDVTSPFLALDIGDSLIPPLFTPVSTPSLDRVVFASGGALTADPGGPGSNTLKVYEKAGSQPVRLVSFATDNTAIPTETLPGGASFTPTSEYSTIGVVSDDGRHIFFTQFTGSNATAIYRRTDGATTTLASPSKRTPADPEGPRPKEYRFATSDGNRVFFTSPELLTDDANTGPGPNRPGNDLYRYDLAADEMVDISATAGGNGAEVVGVVGFDDAGDRVYYVARGAVVAGDGPGGDPDPAPGAPNLYLWEDDGTADGATRFIATLSNADSSNWRRLDGSWTARTSADGGQLVFQSSASIPGPGPDGVSQVYRYDAGADGGAGELACVSCNPNDDPPIGPSTVPNHFSRDVVQRWELPRALSSDGERVFFNSQDDLAVRDSNGEIDAYMWQDGELSLLSPGTGDSPSRVFNASASGDDVFILTSDRLVPQDVDDLADLYDARVGGGFPAPPPRDDCEPNACQGEGAVPPAASPPGSDGLHGSDDLAPRPRLVLGVRRPSNAQLRKLVRGGTIRIRVRVNRAATVRVSLRHRGRGVARGAVRKASAGTVVVKLRLTTTTRRKLRRAGTARLSLTVKATGARPRTLALRLKGTR